MFLDTNSDFAEQILDEGVDKAAVTALRTATQTPGSERAALSEFTLLRGQVLCGNRLEQVRALQASILRFGLISPITAVRSGGRLVVIDGRLRVAALRRLAFQGRLPDALKTVPFRVASRTEAKSPTSRAMRNAALYNAVLGRFRSGDGLDAIAARYSLSRECVRDVLSLSRLDEAVRRSLFERLIGVAQARAFACIGSRSDQRRILLQLGPFATPRAIADAAHRPSEAVAA